MRFAVFASGNGSNFDVIAEAVHLGVIKGEIGMLFCDNHEAYVLERAKKYGIPVVVLEKKRTETKKEYETMIVKTLEKQQIDFIVLAGYMKILGNVLLSAYPQKILNIHPSLLPLFPGKQSIQDAFEAKVKETGITIHLVDDGIDTGPIIYQTSLNIEEQESLASLEQKIHQLEHEAYPRVIADFIKKESSSNA